jgi:threonine/homoserine/homoserine lactone efflux protein
MARALALGFLVGLPIAASPGPMFVLVVRRTLARGWRSGLISGLGVATGDAIYASLAALGVAAVTAFLLAERRWIGLAGGIVIALIGLGMLLRDQSPHPDPAHAGNPATLTTMAPPEGEGNGPRQPPEGEGKRRGQLASAYGLTLGLTLSNPLTILSFVAVFAGLGLRVTAGWMAALALVIGVLLGSLTWWIVLTGVASRLRQRLTPTLMRGIAIVSGVVLLGFGAATVGAALVG